ncbi:globin [Nioella aestuarii]|uniref:globin n=1 Tax=Nioella aestuarii TaxID=1662864 RepID=UPI003D7FF181
MSEVADHPPPLQPDQIALIEGSFTRALRGKAELSDRVYDRFFELEPDTRHLFGEDLVVQRAKIIWALSFTVRAMVSDIELARAAEHLARSHLRFHITETQLRHMEKAILGAFRDCAGEGFTAEMQASWQAAFDRFLPMILSAQDRLLARD